MAKITDDDIINHLKEKINFHMQESKRIEQILAAFTMDTDVKGIKEMTSFSAAPKSRAGAKTKVKTASSKKLIVPSQYSADMTMNNKIAYALTNIGEGFKEDIAQEIVRNEPGTDVQSISKLISGVLSLLKSKGLISAQKEGRKDKFRLLE